MKKKGKTEPSFWNKNKIIALLFLTLILAAVLLVPKFQSYSKKGTLIEGRNDVRKLPKEAVEKLKNATVSASFRVPILLYHYVEYVQDPGDKIRKSLDIIPFTFEKQIQTLRDGGYTFITPFELSDVIDGKANLPAKPVILSFDDGYLDFYTNVFPLLKKYNIKAVAYIISGFLDHSNFMYSWQVQELEHSGLVEIGAHTVHHAYLKGMSKEAAKFEIEQSKKTLENLIGAPVVSFAYPYGAFDLQDVDLLELAGFKTAVTTVPGNLVTAENRFFLFRIRPGARTGDDLLNYLEQNSFKAY